LSSTLVQARWSNATVLNGNGVEEAARLKRA
jgi:hypothetical protein